MPLVPRVLAGCGLACLLLAHVGCSASSPDPAAVPSTREAGVNSARPAWFADVAAASGVRHATEVTTPDPYFMPRLMTGGAAVVDFDRDGRMDLFLSPSGPEGEGASSKLFRQTESGAFEDVTAAAGVAVAGYGQGAAVGDVNNDGWPDVLATGYGRVWLFLNRGNGTFADVTGQARPGQPALGHVGRVQRRGPGRMAGPRRGQLRRLHRLAGVPRPRGAA